jgi:hypothetical protein
MLRGLELPPLKVAGTSALRKRFVRPTVSLAGVLMVTSYLKKDITQPSGRMT